MEAAPGGEAGAGLEPRPGPRTSGRAPNLGPRTPRAVSGGVPLRPSGERGPSGGSHRGAPGPRPPELGSEGGSGQSETSGLADACPAPLLLRRAARTELLGCLALLATGGPALSFVFAGIDYAHALLEGQRYLDFVHLHFHT